MSYIGKVKVGNEWEKVEDLIKAQVSGQSSFAFDGSTKYELQSEGEFGARFCDVSSKPSDDNEGMVITGTQVAFYQPSDGNSLYVKTAHLNFVHLKISVLGA